MVYVIYPRCYEAEPSNPEGITYTTASDGSMWLVPQLTAFHQSQGEKSLAECVCLMRVKAILAALHTWQLDSCESLLNTGIILRYATPANGWLIELCDLVIPADTKQSDNMHEEK